MLPQHGCLSRPAHKRLIDGLALNRADSHDPEQRLPLQGGKRVWDKKRGASPFFHGGYRQIQAPPQRYRLIELAALSALGGCSTLRDLQRAHRLWIAQALSGAPLARDRCWSESLAVGDEPLVSRVKAELGVAAKHRNVVHQGERCALREAVQAYSVSLLAKNRALSPAGGASGARYRNVSRTLRWSDP
jgi:hypothetical protein